MPSWVRLPPCNDAMPKIVVRSMKPTDQQSATIHVSPATPEALSPPPRALALH